MRKFQSGPDSAATAEAFAKELHDAWHVGHPSCNNGVLFLLSVNNRAMYISAGEGTVNKLTYDVLGNIIEDVKPFMKSEEYDEGVERAVVDIGLALSGHSIEPQRDQSSGWDDWIAFGIFVSIIFVFGWLAASNEARKRKRYTDCKSKLEKLKRDQAALRAGGSYNPTSCPVCLEDFVLEANASPSIGGAAAGVAAAAAAPSAPLAPAEVLPSPSAPPLPGSASAGSGAAGISGISSAGAAFGESDAELRQPLMGGAGSAGPAAATSPTAAAGLAGAGSVKECAMAGAQQPAGPPRRPLVLPCGHAFCEPCISQWLDQKKITCPICRRPIDEADDPRDSSNPGPQRPGAPPAPRPDTTATDVRDPASGSGGSSGRPPCSDTMDSDDMVGGSYTFSSAADEAAAAAASAGQAGPSEPRLRLRLGNRRRAFQRLQQDLLMQEMIFRLHQLRRQHPEYVSNDMVQQWETDLQNGADFSTQQLRDFQLRDPASRQALARSGAGGSGVSFGGGGRGGGGGGRGGSW